MGKGAELLPVQSSAGNWKTKLLSAIVAGLGWVMLVGCGDVYRPVANPILKPGGDPQNTHVAVVLSNNNGSPGMAAAIDVSGDSNIGNFVVGRRPVQGSFSINTAVMFVANQGDDTVSTFTPLSQGSPVVTVTLPIGSAPVFVASTESSFMYVANSGTNTVGEISTITTSEQAEIPVGRTPVALAETPDGTRLYCANQGDGTVSVITPQNRTVIATIPVGSLPSAIAINSDGKTVYVANLGSGTVTAIDVASNSAIATVPTGAAPRFMVFDSRYRRLYVANAGSNTISVLNADIGLSLIKAVTVGAGPTSIAPLLDGTRIYVANAGCSDALNLAGCSGNTVSEVDAVSLALRKTITVGNTPVYLAADPGSTKVVVANRDSNTISSIKTQDDSIINNPSGSPQPTFVVISQ
jgi:YVTN family beta-propeller protein